MNIDKCSDYGRFLAFLQYINLVQAQSFGVTVQFTTKLAEVVFLEGEGLRIFENFVILLKKIIFYDVFSHFFKVFFRALCVFAVNYYTNFYPLFQIWKCYIIKKFSIWTKTNKNVEHSEKFVKGKKLYALFPLSPLRLCGMLNCYQISIFLNHITSAKDNLQEIRHA